MSTTRRRHEAWIGGPGTALPNCVESFMAWSVALGCLTVSGYYYLVDSYLKPFLTRSILQRKVLLQGSSDGDKHDDLPCWLPLMSHSHSELDRATPYQRYEQLLQLLRILQKVTQHDTSYECHLNGHTNGGDCNLVLLPTDDDTLVELIRSNELVRRLASLAMRPDESASSSHRLRNYASVRTTQLGRQLARLWPRLLVLPPLPDLDLYGYAISLIVPCYNERAADILHRIQQAQAHCAQSARVQVFLVLSGIGAEEVFLNELNSATALSQVMKEQQQPGGWGTFQIVTFREESGRGPCLNFGAQHADGAVYAFCHSDTQLPPNWDSLLVQTFYPNNDNKCDDSAMKVKRRANSCAFRFGIDTTEESLKGGLRPRGIRAVEFTANLRCEWWSLPYGDQCLSIPSSNFEYLGGFPHQCFMEDYDLIALLRRRASLLPQFLQRCAETRSYNGEKLLIIPGAPALCSPRRWQRLGVIYVTFTNSKLVGLYALGRTTPDEIYRRYYGQSLAVTAPKSPWEIQLETLLSR